ncbi:Lachrymatory-factor synthase [Nymphaea thermarum]|nr:Lachrymatory-factor synthase [Nymphaea thermarum]
MGEEEQQQLVRWEGKLSATIGGATADQVWPLVADFCSLDRWFPSVQTCRLEGGVAGEPGCVRYTAGKGIESADGEGVAWARERLVSIDPAGRKLSYEITENNVGWGQYEAAMEVIEGGGMTEDGGGCRIEWSFRMEPMEGGSEEGVAAYLGHTLEEMAKRMEKFLLHTPGGAQE